MKKRDKHEDPEAAPKDESRGEVDVAGLMDKIQHQLAFLERKIDLLISQSSQRPSEEKSFSKPFQRFDRPQHYSGPQRQDSNFRERTLHKAICADCNNECEVPFRPTGDRPVYCRDCFSKHKVGEGGGGGGGGFRERHHDRPSGGDFAEKRHERHEGGYRKMGKKRKSGPPRRRKGRD